MLGRKTLKWTRDGDAWVVANGRGREPARVVPDDRYLGMWRVRTGHGRLSEALNFTRAKDAAASWALAVLNRGETAARGSSARPAGEAALLVTPDGKILFDDRAQNVPPPTGR